jgi:hypothetical protein
VKSFNLILILLFCLASFGNAPGDQFWGPLLTITFPLNNRDITSKQDIDIVYILNQDGSCENERCVYGEGGEPPNFHIAWLNNDHVVAVLNLIRKIVSSKGNPQRPTDTMFVEGAIVYDKKISVDYRTHLDDIRLMLRYMGGVRGDLEDHLSKKAKSTSQPQANHK